MYKKLLKSASAILIQKHGGLAYPLTHKGLEITKPLIIIYKRYYEFDKLRVVFIDGTAIEGEISSHETFFMMKDYVILS